VVFPAVLTRSCGAVPNKLAGVLTMFGAIATLFVLPWIDTSRVRSMRYRPDRAALFSSSSSWPASCSASAGPRPPDDPVIPGVTSFTLIDKRPEQLHLAVAGRGPLLLRLLLGDHTHSWGSRRPRWPAPESISEPVLSHPAITPHGRRGVA